MSTNLSLMNPGTSLNFDGQVLQNAQEEECRQEEEQQHNELKQLLTNAFDDLIDDDEFSITSDEGGPSTNGSLHLGAKTESPGDGAESETGQFLDSRNQWTPVAYQGMAASAPGIPPQSLATIYEAASVRSSQENPLRNSQEISTRGSQDLLRSSQEDFSVRNSRDQPLRSSQDYRDQTLRSSQEYRDQTLRSSQEYLDQSLRGSQEYQQGYQDYHQAGGGAINSGEEFQSDGYHSNNSEQESATPSYNINPQAFDWINQATQDSHVTHQQSLGLQGGYGGYQGGVMEDHVSTRYPDLPVRQETEGGNNNVPSSDPQTYHPHQSQGIYSDTYPEDQPRGGNFQPYTGLPHSQGYQSTEVPPNSQGFQSAGVTQDYYAPSAVSDDRNYHTNSADPYMTHDEGQTHDPYGSYDLGQGHGKLPQLQLGSKEYQEDYRVQYQRRQGVAGERGEEEDRSPRREKPKALEEKTEETGGLDPRQYSQLQVLYKARGRKLEEISNEYEILKQETSREIRILKHQVSVAKGEQEAATTSLKQVQDLLKDSKGDNAQLLGRNKAVETELNVLKKSKDEVLKKLHVAESNIESLNQQLLDLGNSESLARARHDHEVVIAGIQRKHQQEVKVANEKIQELHTRISDLSGENKTLRQKLEESYQSAEKAQISRAETINRLTRSLEDSQKQCQALLESTSSHELSQLKIQLQQTIASRKIADDMCHTYQEELQDLKEQLSMFESASALGVLTTGQASSDLRHPTHDDSLLDLGIKKTLDFDTPESKPSTGLKSSRFDGSASDDMVTGLKAELERCLLSNKQKRQQVAQIQEELRVAKKEIGELTQRCERAELSSEDYKKRLDEWEELTRSGDRKSAVEGRLKKDIENLCREKEILMEDIEDLKKRLEEVGSSEEKLTDMNRELNKQISQMVQDFDNDKREALDRCQRTLESVHEVAKSQLRQEMEKKYEEDKASLVNKYEEDCTNLRNDLDSTLRELDEVKQMYVRVCTEKDNIQQEVRAETEADTARKLEQIKADIEHEKKEEIERVKEEGTEREAGMKEQLKKELEEESRRSVDTKVALAKVTWFEEQRSAKQTAVEKAVKLTETEWKIKLENSVQSEVDSRLHQAKEEWTAQRRLSFESELKKQLQTEREAIESKLAAEYSQRLETERAKWIEDNQSEMRRSLEREKSRAKTKTELDVETAVKKESDKWKKKMEDEVKKKVDEESKRKVKEEMEKKVEELKKKMDKELEEKVGMEVILKLEEVKVGLEEEVKARLEEEVKVRLEEEVKARLDDARKDWEINNELETQKKIHNEKEKWNRRKSNEIQERLEEERLSLQEEQDKHQHERLEKERAKWESTHQEQVTEDKATWIREQEQKNMKVLERAKQVWEESHELSVEKIRESMEEQIHERISAEVSLAIDEARTDWSRERDLEVTANLSTELSSNVLKEEIEVLKSQTDRLQQEIKQRDETWHKERADLTRQKDAERKQAMEDIQDQCERDYKKFTAEHHDTLTQALRAAREQHTRDKTDLERRYSEEIESLKQKESHLQEKLQNLGLEEPTYDRSTEKEREMFEKEKWRLQQEVQERDALLEQADFHLSQEVEKLRSELESAYQRRLEAETASLKQKFDLESNRPDQREKVLDKTTVLETEIKKLKDENNKICKEKQNLVLELETLKSENQKILVELLALRTDKEVSIEENNKVKTEVQKVKAQMFEETKRYVKEVQDLNSKMAEQSQVLSEFQAEREELSSAKVVCQTLVNKNESLLAEKQSLMEEREKILNEMDSIKSENEDLSKLKFEIEKLHIEAEVFTKLRAEVERLETENEQISHLRANVDRLEAENAGMNKLRAKVARLEAETDRMSQLKVEVAQLQAENTNITALRSEIDRLQTEVEEVHKLRSEVQKLEKEKEGLASLETEIEHLKSEVENVSKLRSEVERLQVEMKKHQDKITKVEDEKSRLVENIRGMESAYRRDMVSQKQRQEDTNNRLRQAEKHLTDAKQHYRSQIDKLKKSLETENNMAMETMKNKMVDMQKAHLVALDAMKKQFRSEVEGMRLKVKEERPQKNLNSIEVQTDSEDDEQGVMELREQYLDTVNKIKDDVMRHITETNMRAAETVRCEMTQERNTTLSELKRIYMENVRKILQNEIMGANIEAKLADIEQALDVISFDKPLSRSSSPRSSRSSTPTPTREVEGSHIHEPQGSRVNNGVYSGSVSNVDQTRIPRGVQTDRFGVQTDRFGVQTDRFGVQTDRFSHNGYSSVNTQVNTHTDESYGTQLGDIRNNRAPAERTYSGHTSEHPHNSRSLQRPQSVRTVDRPNNGSMLPPKDRIPAPRGQTKEVKFSRTLEERHSRTRSLPGSRINGKDKLVSFRTVSPISSSDNSDPESFITTRRRQTDHSNHHNKLPSRFLSPSNEPRLSSSSNSSFVAVDPRPQNTQPHGNMSLYKTVSEPELGTDQPRTDHRFSNYKYTSLRDGLAKYRSPSPIKDNTSASHDDLRAITDPELDILDRKAYSIDVGLNTFGLDRTSPRKFNPSPERLNTSNHDAGESPVGTPRRGQKVTEKRSQSSGPRSREVTKSAPWDIEKRYYSYRYQEPVKHLVEKYQGLSIKD